MFQAFLDVARRLNRAFAVRPLLYGSLGLQQRLREELSPDDIDVLVPEEYVLGEKWPALARLMEDDGYALIDLHEHTFQRESLRVAFAALENLETFAAIDIGAIPTERTDGAEYLLLSLEDYLKVYTASAKDGYRMNHKNKQDHRKILLIREKLGMP